MKVRSRLPDTRVLAVAVALASGVFVLSGASAFGPLGAADARAASGSITGTAVYSDGSQASRVLAFAVPAHETGVVPTYETLTNAAGDFSLGSVPPGEYFFDLIVVPAGETHETRFSKTVQLAEGEALALGTVNVGVPAVSEARTQSEIIATGTLSVTVKTSEGVPATGAQLMIQGFGGGTTTVPSSGIVTTQLQNGPFSVSATFTPPDSSSSASASASATVTAGSTTSVELTLPAGAPLAVPTGVVARNSERNLAFLNAERARWGLPAGLRLNAAWSQACAAHDSYLADNHRIEHPEDASLPGASPGGEWAGLHAVLAGGSGWSAEGNPWEDAPIHLDQLFTPDLSIIGIDESRNVACATTWPGIGGPLFSAGSVLTYPGDGTSGLPPAENAAESPFVPGKFAGVPEGTVAGRELFVYEEVGSCVTFFCPPANAPTVESASLLGPSGPVTTRWVDGSTPEVGGFLTGAILIPVTPLAPNASYTAEVKLAPFDGLPAVGHRWTFTTGTASPTGVAPGSIRSLRSLRIVPRRFTVARRNRGARVSYVVSTAGVTSFVVERTRRGARAGKHCKAAVGHVPRSAPCSLHSRVYSFSHRDRRGGDSFRLTGRYGRRKLGHGTYRLVARAGTSSVAASFTITG